MKPQAVRRPPGFYAIDSAESRPLLSDAVELGGGLLFGLLLIVLVVVWLSNG